MRVGILGPLEVLDGADRPVELSGQRLRTLLIRLAVEAGHTVAMDRLVDDVWADAPPAVPGKALHTLVSRLRGAGGRDLVEAVSGGYRLAVDPGEIDAVAFERAVATAQLHEQPAERAQTLRGALALWRGRALADVADAPFARAVAARLEELRLAATEDRVEADLAAGEAGHLVAELEGLCAAHPLRERLRGQLMRALYLTGRQADALKVYEDLRERLADQLGVDPSAELAAVRLAILRRSPSLDRPAAPGPATRRSNLPAPLTSFVGRDEESARIGVLLGEARLVTLTGPGGAGKTRLASEVAAELAERYPDGAWFVPLAPVVATDDVSRAALVAIGVPDVVRMDDAPVMMPPLERLVDALATRRLLLVLDNCEHVVDAVAALADRALAGAPGLHILATSREPLGITGETLCPVPALPLPAAGAGADEARRSASVQLFADRAAAVRPGFSVNGETAARVAQVCRELDGLPLAIELAAARLRSLTLDQVADRLSDRFGLLGGGSRTAPKRHQTLRAVVDWSWDLLDDAERRVLRRLSVFSGGATPSSAQRVCGLDGQPDVLDVVAALIDKSLVHATGERDVRYRLLETVRAYAAERLAESDERARVAAAHAAYFLDLAERAEPELRRHDQLRWTVRLTAERDNLNAALRHAVDARDVPTALRLVGSLAWFWFTRDHATEAGGWATAVRAIAGDAPPPGLADEYAICMFTSVLAADMAGGEGPSAESVGRALATALSRMPDKPRHPVLALAGPVAAMFAGDVAGAQAGLRALAGHPDPWVGAAAHACLGFLALEEGRLDDAAARLADAYTGFRGIGERWGMIVGLSGLADVVSIRGDAAEAVRLAEEAHRYAIEGVSRAQGALLVQLGRARAEAGDTARARAEIEQGVRTAERLGEYDDAADGLRALSDLSRLAGDLALARQPLDRALDLAEPGVRRSDFARSRALTFSRLGGLATQAGDLAAAAAWHTRAADLTGGGAAVPGRVAAAVTEGLAALAAARGAHERAAELLGTAHAQRGYRDGRGLDARWAAAEATRALGPAAFASAYERGRSAPDRADAARSAASTSAARAETPPR